MIERYEGTLDPVIRRCKEPSAKPKEHQILVEIDPDTLDLVTEPRWLSRKKVLRYLVTKHGRGQARFKVQMSVGHSDKNINLALECVVTSTLHGAEHRVAWALAGHGDPLERLVVFLERWVQTFLETQRHLLAEPALAMERLTANIRGRCHDTVGLDLNIEIDQPMLDARRAFRSLGPCLSWVKTEDWPEQQHQLKWWIDFDNSVLPTDTRSDILGENKVKALLESKIESYIFSSIKLHQLHYELATTVTRQLTTHLDTLHLGFLPKINNLSLELLSIHEVPKIPLRHSVMDYETGFWSAQPEARACFEGSVELADLATFLKTGERSPAKVSRSQALAVTRHHFLELEVRDVALRKDQIIQQVEENIAHNLAEAGLAANLKLKLEGMNLDLPIPEPIENLEVPIQLLDFQESLQVTAFFRLVSLEYYVAAGGPDLQSWLEAQLHSEIQTFFFGRSYRDFFTTEEEDLGILQETIERSSIEKIGHEARLVLQTASPKLTEELNVALKCPVKLDSLDLSVWIDAEARLELSSECLTARRQLAHLSPGADAGQWLRKGWESEVNHLLNATVARDLVLNPEETNRRLADQLGRRFEQFGYLITPNFEIHKTPPTVESLPEFELEGSFAVENRQDRVSVKLEVFPSITDPAKYLRFLLASTEGVARDRYRDKIREIVRRALTAELLTTQESRLFTYPDAVRDVIVDRTRGEVHRMGLDIRIRWLAPTQQDFDGIRESLLINIDDPPFTIQLRDYDHPVEVRSRALLKLDSPSLFIDCRFASSEILAEWVRQKICEVTAEAFFDLTFTEACTQYSAKRNEIFERLQGLVAGTGYSIRQLTTLSELKPPGAQEYTLRIGGEESDLEFQTREAQIKVRLQVDATLRLENLEGVTGALDQGKSVEDVLAEAGRQALSDVLHQVHPHRYYTEFESLPDPDSLEAGDSRAQMSVRQALCERLEQSWRDPFNAEVVSLSCKALKTPLSETLDDLKKNILMVETHYQDLAEGIEIPYVVRLRVWAVRADKWSHFYEQFSDGNARRKVVESALHQFKSCLSGLRAHQLLSAPDKALQKHFGSALEDGIADELGLQISVHSMERQGIPDEVTRLKIVEAEAKANRDMAVAAIERGKKIRERNYDYSVQESKHRQERIKSLNDQLLQEEILGNNPEKKELLEASIRKLRQEEMEEEETLEARNNALVSKALLPNDRLLPKSTAQAPRLTKDINTTHPEPATIEVSGTVIEEEAPQKAPNSLQTTH